VNTPDRETRDAAMSRRDILQIAAAAATGATMAAGNLVHASPAATAGSQSAAAASSTGAGRTKLWIDPALRSLPARPWRKVHLDFHNSQHITRIGERFNANEFGDLLAEAEVNAIVVFAKDMHGYFYYPSKYGPVHPGLKFDLLGAQVEACRKRKIAVYAYYCTCWDNYLAETRPEWLQVRRDRTNYLPKFDQVPSWTGLCAAHEPFVRLMVDHTTEFVSRYELDGAWFDMPVARDSECFCRECLRALEAAGKDPADKTVQHIRSHDLHVNLIARLTKAAKSARPGCQVDYNQQGRFGLAQRVPHMDNIDLEALPTGSWGYYYFPTSVRYVRNHHISVYGMTGRFVTSWADFGGLKTPAQLQVESASIVANAAGVDVGDQMPPNGRLDPAVYHVIGKAFRTIRRMEPYLDQAVPVAEAALLVSGVPASECTTEANYGLVKLLMESHLQFDIVEPSTAWERYGTILLPEDRPVSEAMANRLHQYLAQGGSVIVVHHGGLLEGTQKSWLERYGLTYEGDSPFKPAYLVPGEKFTGDIPAYEYALYDGASQWKIGGQAVEVARLGVPAFQRGPKSYTSHRHTPFDHASPYAAIARAGRLALFGFPLGTSYIDRGYWVYRAAFQHVWKSIAPAPVLETNAPVNTEVTVTHQAARPDAGRPERYLVHVVNFSPTRGIAKHPVYHDDPSPLVDITLKLNLPLKLRAVQAAVSGQPLKFKATSSAVEVTLAKVPIHELISFELA
jgi:hypothetical protein